VQCPTSAQCIAVGQYNTSTVTKTMALRWNSNRWSLLSSPNADAPVNVLTGLACASSTSCFAVGSYFVSTATTSSQLTLVERWDGKSWTIVPSPNVADAFDSGLEGVACAGSTDCFGVGTSHTETTNDTLVEHWDGASWSIVPSPDPPDSADNDLAAVACPATANCIAVGSSDHGTLAERWNGSSWSVVTSKNPLGSTGAALAAIACPAATRCTAAGVSFQQTVDQRLVEVFTPSSASLVGVPVPSDTKRSNLSGISCANTTNCFAVGDYRRGPSRRPLLLRYGS
jgi:hypothetical protein